MSKINPFTIIYSQKKMIFIPDQSINCWIWSQFYYLDWKSNFFPLIQLELNSLKNKIVLNISRVPKSFWPSRLLSSPLKKRKNSHSNRLNNRIFKSEKKKTNILKFLLPTKKQPLYHSFWTTYIHITIIESQSRFFIIFLTEMINKYRMMIIIEHVFIEKTLSW